MKDRILCFRTFLLEHFHGDKLQSLIYGLLSYQMITYVFFGIFTSVIDVGVYSILTYLHINILVANILSTLCAIVVAYITNKRFVFNSAAHGFSAVFYEFMRFSEARIATLLMTELILLICHLLHGNPYTTKIFAMVLTVCINYIVSKLYIFNSKQKGTKSDEKF